MLLKEKNYGMSYVVGFYLVAALLFWLTAISAFGQTDAVAQSSQADIVSSKATVQAALQPAVNDLKGIVIGMTAEQVKDKLGKAKTSDDNGFYYVFSDGESMQIALDADKKVRLVAAIYTGDEANAPKYQDIFGADTTMEPQADGKIYKLVRYPDAGFWVTYNRIMVGDEPMTTVTMQKM